MILSFAEHCLRMRAWPTRGDLVEALASCGGGYLVLGDTAEYATGFHSIAIFPRGIITRHFAIGICSETDGLPPNLLLKPEIGLIIVGYNSAIAGISVPGGEIRFEVQCDWLFSQFLDLPARKVTLALYEVGVLALSDAGEELWRRSTEIILDWTLLDDRLTLEFIDAPPMSLDLSTGEPLPAP